MDETVSQEQPIISTPLLVSTPIQEEPKKKKTSIWVWITSIFIIIIIPLYIIVKQQSTLSNKQPVSENVVPTNAPNEGAITEINFEGNGTCAKKKWKEWSTYCGGAVPVYNLRCGHWDEQQAYIDEGKACVTGKDCCSGFCGQESYNGKLVCVPEGGPCNTYPYIDNKGNLHEAGQCVR